jgi:exodeoxyribonuclease VII large subunit
MMRASAPIVPDATVSVSRLANYLARKLSIDPKLRRLGVSGEISGLSPQANGTIYFDLKDRDALIKCVAWSETAQALPPLANGQAVVAIGSVGTYARKGNYQLTVVAVELEGAGRLHGLYEALKRRLDAEGLFAQSRKRALPIYPFRVALISSRTANGAGDFLTQAAAIAPHVTIDFIETPVQGETAAPEIVRAIDRASRADVDLVVLARGGGSYEDLFVFSDERVVRALARCAHPTVSAIGHEADAPLTDFVADRREPTPSAAAQSVLPRRAELLRTTATLTTALERCLNRGVERLRRDFARIEIRSPLASPERLLQGRRRRVDEAGLDLGRSIGLRLRASQARLDQLRARLEQCNPSVRLGKRRERLMLTAYALEHAAHDAFARSARRSAAANDRLGPAAASALARLRAALERSRAVLVERDPTKILQRGYAIVTVDGVMVRDVAVLAPGMRITAQLARGRVDARVERRLDDGGTEVGDV